MFLQDSHTGLQQFGKLAGWIISILAPVEVGPRALAYPASTAVLLLDGSNVAVALDGTPTIKPLSPSTRGLHEPRTD